VKAGARVFRIGEPVDLTYPVTDLGNDLSLLGRVPRDVIDAFPGSGRCLAVIVGTGALRTRWLPGHPHAGDVPGARFNLLHTAASRVGALDLGFAPRADWTRSGRGQGRSGAVSCSASTKRTCPPSRTRSPYTSARTATPACGSRT
jgi:hypothetical protein